MNRASIILCITSSIMAAPFNRANFPAFGETRVNSAWTAIALNGQSNPSSGPDVYGCNDPNDWALTYDDGPGDNTDGVLTALRDRGFKATFFVVGQQVVQYPDVLRKIYNEGHEIALHTWSHKSLPSLTNDQIIAEIVWNARAIRDIIGIVPNVIRPPYGNIDGRVRSVLQALGLKIIIWNVDTNDWTYAGKSSGETLSGITNVINRCISGCSSKNPNQGGISLEHDYPYAFAITNVLDIMRGSRFNLKTVSQCVGIEPYSSSWLDRIEGISILPPPTTTVASSTTVTSSSSSLAVTTINSRPETVTRTDTSQSTTQTMVSTSQPAINASYGSSDGLSAIGTFLLVVFTIFLYV